MAFELCHEVKERFARELCGRQMVKACDNSGAQSRTIAQAPRNWDIAFDCHVESKRLRPDVLKKQIGGLANQRFGRGLVCSVNLRRDADRRVTSASQRDVIMERQREAQGIKS